MYTEPGDERDGMICIHVSCTSKADYIIVEVMKRSRDERERTRASRLLPGPGTPVRSALDVNLAPDHLAKPCTTALPLTNCSCSCQIAHHGAH
jgi:hypothetical protein